MSIPSTLSRWSVIPQNSLNVAWSHGSPVPAPRHIKILASDFLEIMDSYSDFKIVVTALYKNNAPHFIEIDGDYFSNGEIYPATLSDIDNYLVFKDLENIPAGNYTVNVTYRLAGLKGGEWDYINHGFVTLNLNISGSGQPIIKAEKSVYTCYYDKVKQTLSGDTIVTVLNNNPPKLISFTNDGTFEALIGELQNFTLSLNNTSGLPENGEKTIIGKINIPQSPNQPLGTVISVFEIKIIILESSITLTPDRLDFYSKKSLGEIISKEFSIINPNNLPFAITSPDWLDLSVTSGSSTTSVAVKNVNPHTLADGFYQGAIKVLFGDEEASLAVSLEVVSTFTHNFDEDYNFCLDSKVLTVLKNDKSAFFAKITLKMTFKDDYNDVIVDVPYQIPFFRDLVTFNVGAKIHSAFLKNRKSILEEGTVAYSLDNKVHLHPAKVVVVLEELDANWEVLNNQEITSRLFYPGKKPKAFPFLTNHMVRSYYKGQKLILSYLSGLVKSSDIVDVVVTENGLPSNAIARVKVEDGEGKINYDLVKVFKTQDTEPIIYYNMDSDATIVHVQWENQNLSSESASFTGDYTIPLEFTHLTQKNMFTGNVEKYATLSDNKIMINTGFILKGEVGMIEEIINSKFCILQIKGVEYKGHCVSSKFVREDKKRQLVEYDLEFEIND